tara:strand:+ start:67 stop:474 length:408 start_codon:yes stop_codon:yes gene_type:complete
MTKKIRAKNYDEFGDYWKEGIDCYYGGSKTSHYLYIENSKIYCSHPSTVMIGERVGENFVLYNYRNKDYCTDLMKWYNWTQRRSPQLKYATLGRPPSLNGRDHSYWLTNQLYEGLLRVATHILHPDQSLEDLEES